MKEKKKVVMIVEDNQNISSFMTSVIKERGYDVSSVSDSSQAFDMFCYMYPDVIVFDSTAKGAEAVIFRSKVRLIPELEFVPFLFLFDPSYLKEDFSFLGMDEYVVTPFQNLDLVTRIDTVLNRFENYSIFMEVDEVCKIFTKRKFMEKLDVDIIKNKRYGNSVTVIMFWLKSSNKEAFAGYDVRHKELLGSIGKIIKESLRSTDYCGRYTLNSFITVLTETDSQRGKIVAERIIEKCEGIIKKMHTVAGDIVTLTAGISQVGESDEYSKNITDRISHALRENGDSESAVLFV